MTEEWRPCPDYPAYAVSSIGRVKRVMPNGNGLNAGRILSGYDSGHGYRMVKLTNSNGHHALTVHRLICRAFHGPPPSGMHQVAHNDGNSRNNRADNLRWATHYENMMDKYIHGTAGIGEKNGRAKLSQSDVLSIIDDDRTHKAIAEHYKCHPHLVYLIKKKKVWTHLHGTALSNAGFDPAVIREGMWQ